MDVKIYDDADSIDKFPALVYDCGGNIFVATSDVADEEYFNLYCLGCSISLSWNSQDVKYRVGSTVATKSLANYKRFNGSIVLKN